MFNKVSVRLKAEKMANHRHDFRRRYFPGVSLREWNDYHWQLRHRLQSAADINRIIPLTDKETAAMNSTARTFSVSITPYYASLIDAASPQDPVRRTVIPTPDEFQHTHGELRDPLAEDNHTPVPGLVHRYPDRALFLVTDYCPVYCRYCTRSRLVGGKANFDINRQQWQRALDYIAATPAIRDVLVSGGDPLIYDDERLEWLLQRLRAISHLEMIRVGTKVPFVLPQRVTPQLSRMLKRYHPLYFSLHVIHPAEITPESTRACHRLADAGIPLGSQTVLLKGVNDDVETIRALMHQLLKIRVKPYYLLQCDPILGSAHFRTPVARGADIIDGLRGHTSGYAVPHFIIDIPNGGGKVSLVPEYVTGHDDLNLYLRNYQGKTGLAYPDPVVPR